MIPLAETLQHCPLFEGIAPEDLTAMLGCLGARHTSYAKGDILMDEGAPPKDVGILLKGQLQLIRTDYYGNRSIMMNIAPGQLFAESFACARAERLPVSIVAAEDCETLLLDCNRVLTMRHGKVLLDGTPAEVFSHPEELSSAYVQPTDITRIAQALDYMPNDVTSVDEFCDLFAQLMEKEG